MGMSYLTPLNPQFFKKLAYVRSFKLFPVKLVYMYFAKRPRSSLTAVYSDLGYAVITDHALSNIIFEILSFLLLKVEVISQF